MFYPSKILSQSLAWLSNYGAVNFDAVAAVTIAAVLVSTIAIH
jgi:hypothetical protein